MRSWLQELERLRALCNALWECASILPRCIMSESERGLVQKHIGRCVQAVQDSRHHPLRLDLYGEMVEQTQACKRWVYPLVPTERVQAVFLVPFNGHGEDTEIMEAINVN